LGLEKEKISAEPLLIKVVQKGRIVYRLPSVDKIRISVKNILLRFPQEMKETYSRYEYPVIISPQLKKLRRTLAFQLEKRQ